MTATVKALTARKPHMCDSCHWNASLRGVHTITPGHRYLRHVAFPDGEVNTSNRPFSIAECVACAEEREPTAGLLIAGACSTFCCGDTSCALPFKHGGDRHSCRRCAVDSGHGKAAGDAA